MRPHGVVVHAPGFNDLLCLRDTEKPVLVQALIAKLAVEAFDIRVFDRFAGANEAQREAAVIRPRIERAAGKFRPVVADQDLRQADRLRQALEDAWSKR